jgi:glycosyltransferase involved in cell wall biosynthesis
MRTFRVGMLGRLREIRSALSEMAGNADLLHLHSNGLLVEVAADWARRQRRPFVLTLYGTEIWHYRRRPIFDPFTRTYRRAGAVTFYSQRLLERARELGLDRDNLVRVYPAVHDAFRQPDTETRAAWRRALAIEEPHVILNVKRLHELAGQRYLIDAFARIAARRADVRLVICGAGGLREKLESQARALGVSERITFAGLVANDVVARYAAIADVFALPSLLEALPTVAVEALAAGTPVVSADHPGGEELHALFGDDVRVVARRDVAALAEALGAAVDAPRRARPETASTVERLFSPEAIMNAYDAVYARCLTST